MNDAVKSIFSQPTEPYLDLHDRRRLLEDNLDRIFSQGAVDFWQHEKETNIIQDLQISSVDLFRTQHTLERIRKVQFSSNSFFFISQGHSWSRLKVSAELLLLLLAQYRVNPVFLDFLHCYGAKVTGQDNPYYTTFHASLSPPYKDGPSPFGQYYDFCYHMRRYETHDDLQMKDPWSLRQMTVYQRFHFETCTSTWILVKPFQRCQSILRTAVQDDWLKHPMAIHVFFYSMVGENWRWYVDFLRRAIGDFTEKAMFSSTDPMKMDYDIKFADTQRLRTLESKLSVAIAVIEQNLELGKAIQRHCQSLDRMLVPKIDVGASQTIQDRIEMHISHLKLHKISCELLLHQLRETCQLIFRVLDSRSNAISKEYERITVELAKTANSHTDRLNKLAGDAKYDSRMMAVLTTVTLIYVPANLVASIFSSGLIKTSDESLLATSFHVSKDMWIFFLSSLVITTITMLLALCWTGRRK